MARTGGFDRIAALMGFGLLAGAMMLALSAPAHALPANQAPVYAIDEYPFQKAPALLRWRSVLQRETHLATRANPDECKQGQPRLACAAKEVMLLEEKLQDMAPTEQVEAVYAYFNAIQYKEHPANCGIDCWKSRLEFLAQREGDCGDHAIAEYFTLKRLGFKERDLQLIVAQMPGFEDSFKGGHVVLRVRAEGEYYILDNRRTDLVGLSGLKKYKVLAGMNAASVQIYNLIADAPDGAVADASRFVASPGAAQETEATQVAEAEAAVEKPAPAKTKTFETQSAPTLVAAVATDADEDESSAMCMQSARLADWNPFLPCTPQKTQKIVVKAKTIIGAEPPTNATPAKPTQVAEAPKAEAPKAPEPEKIDFSKPIDLTKPAVPEKAKPQQVAEAPKTTAAKKPELEKIDFSKPIDLTKPAVPEKKKPKLDLTKPAAASEAKADENDDDSLACMQGARLADWKANQPCTPGGTATTLRIEFKDDL